MQHRLLLLSVLVLTSLIAALVAGILRAASGGRVPQDIQSGAVAFVASMTLGVLIMTWLGAG
jgi:hypothetical protein